MKLMNLNFEGEKGGVIITVPFEAQKRCHVCQRLFEPRLKMERLCPSCKKPGGEMNMFLSHFNPPPPSHGKLYSNMLVA